MPPPHLPTDKRVDHDPFWRSLLPLPVDCARLERTAPCPSGLVGTDGFDDIHQSGTVYAQKLHSDPPLTTPRFLKVFGDLSGTPGICPALFGTPKACTKCASNQSLLCVAKPQNWATLPWKTAALSALQSNVGDIIQVKSKSSHNLAEKWNSHTVPL